MEYQCISNCFTACNLKTSFKIDWLRSIVVEVNISNLELDEVKDDSFYLLILNFYVRPTYSSLRVLIIAERSWRETESTSDHTVLSVY